MLGPAAAAVAAIAPGLPDAAEFVRLASADPLPVWNALGAAWQERGNATAAAAADAALLDRDPKFAAARFRRARAALDAERPEDAVAELGRCGSDAASAAAYYLLGARALQEQGKDGDAVALLERGLDATNSPEVPVALSDLYASSGDFASAERALAVLEGRARTQQERSDAVVRRVLLLVRSGEVADALAQARRALGIDPTRVDLWRLAADLAERLGDTPGVVWALRELSRRQPKDAAIRDRLRQAETRATEIRLLTPR
jgi:tetratricopeptide (TPR) repeat protein